MKTNSAGPQPGSRPGRRRRGKRLAAGIAGGLAVYLSMAYVVAPLAWKWYSSRHPSFDANPRITSTADGHPGDPLNVGLIGSETQVRWAMRQARWFAADPLGLKSDLRIGVDTVLRREYTDAPVSNLYLFDRKEDLAFEQPVGDNPRHRHHVRFWRSRQLDREGRPIWIGSASYDQRVGLSHTTGEVTHHIAADVDAERGHLLATLQQAQALSESFKVPRFHTALKGHNGGGDPWHTDGQLWVGVIAEDR